MEKEKRMPVEVYSRVVGYFRPVNQWNKGKEEEFEERQTMKVPENLIYRASTRKFSEKVTV